MASPVADSYSAASGASVYGGRYPGGALRDESLLASVLAGGGMGLQTSDLSGEAALAGVAADGTMTDGVPAWWRAATVGQWVAISGTANPGAGLAPNAFSDMTIRPADSTLFIVAAGGHADGSSNAAVSINLTADSPAWTTLRPSSWNGSEANVLYYADGSPCSRHTYHHTHYIASLDAVLLAGCRFGYGGGTPTGPGLDLFDLATNDYLPRYTWPDATSVYGIVEDGDGNIWTAAGYKINGSTGVSSKPGSGTLLRYPAAYDSVNNKIFAMQYDDGEGYATVGFQAVQLDPTTGNSQTITINSSAAKTAFIAATPAYCGMAYCPLDQKFYFMNPAAPQTLYVVTPNVTTTWDMETLTVGGATLPNVGATLCKRLLWVPGLQGFVVQTDAGSNLHFMRMT